MAERRMFAKTIVDSDAFLDMPLSTQALYFHLAMRADDDGFINNPLKIMRIVGANKNDIDLLSVKKFIIAFESGVIVIKHWRMHNYIRADRYNPTIYQEEYKKLDLKNNKSYTLPRNGVTSGIPNDNQRLPQVRLGKDSIGKDSIELDYITPNTIAETIINDPITQYGDYGWIKLKQSQYDKLKTDYPKVDIDNQIKLLDEYVQSNGNKNKYKDFNLVLRKSIRENWFNDKSSTKKEKAVPKWFDEFAEKSANTPQVKPNIPSSTLEELESFFNVKKEK